MKTLRIARAQVYRYTLPFSPPLATARGKLRERRGLILELEAETGERGLGEAAPLPGFSEEGLPFVEGVLDNLARFGSALAGFEVTSASIREFTAGLELVSSAAHAVDQALLAVLAARRKVPAAHLLRPVARTDVPEHALARNAKDAVALVREGYSTLKIKVGAQSLSEDEDRVAAIRKAVGPEVALRLDANGAWSSQQAIRAIKRLVRFDIHSVEQPVEADNLDGMWRVRASVPVPIAADESVRTLKDLRALVAVHAADAVVIKPMLAGGVFAAQALAAAAARAKLSVSLTTSFESVVGRASARDLAVACPAPLWSCGLETGHLFAGDLDPAALSTCAQEVTLLPSGLSEATVAPFAQVFEAIGKSAPVEALETLENLEDLSEGSNVIPFPRRR